MLVGAGTSRWRSVACAAAVLAGALVAIAPSSTASATFSCGGERPSYTVQRGDGWFAIADRVDVGVSQLLAENGAELDTLLVPGDRLCLPDGADLSASCGSTVTVRSGDGWFVIAGRAGVATSSLLAANGADLGRTIHPGEVLCLPAGSSAGGASTSAASGGSAGSYRVVRGDSWFGIAERADVSLRSLLDANGASSSTALHPGDDVWLPAGARVPEPAVTSIVLDALPAQGPCWFGDTWHDARSGGRRHLGVDLFSRSGDYVYAVVDGRLTSRSWEQPGSRSGNAWMLTGADGNRYFYAHLADFAPEVKVGSWVAAGQIIGWVGSTGNSSAPHLHFEIRPGGGVPINPYPILRAQGGCNDGTPYTQPGGWVPARMG